MGYDVRSGGEGFSDLSPKEALAKLHELIADGADPHLFDSFGDPMGVVELERAIASVRFPDNA